MFGWPLVKLPELLIVAIEEYLFEKENSSSTVMGTIRCLIDSLWVQLNKFASLISWLPWLENWESCVIKKVFSERTLQEGENHLFCDDKIYGFKIWLVEV